MSNRDATPTGGRRPYERTKHPGVWRRGSSYVVRVRVGDGRKVERSARTITEAKAIRAELVAARRKGHAGTLRDRSTVAGYAEAWLTSYTGRTQGGVRASTVAEYRRDLELHVLPALGRRPLAELAPQEVKLLVRGLTDGTAPTPRGFTRRPLAPGSIRNALAPLRAMLATAVEEGVLVVNPCAAVRVPAPRLADRDLRVLEPWELDRLAGAAPAGMGRCLVRLAAESALRASELLGLEWRDLDLAANPPRLRVERGYVGGQVAAPKTGHGKRVVPITRGMAGELRAWRVASAASQARDPVFIRDELGERASARLYGRRVLEPAIREAGLGPPFGWHTLRRSRITAWLRAGMPVHVASRLAGHASVAFTLSVYAFALPSDLPDLDRLAGGS